MVALQIYEQLPAIETRHRTQAKRVGAGYATNSVSSARMSAAAEAFNSTWNNLVARGESKRGSVVKVATAKHDAASVEKR